MSESHTLQPKTGEPGTDCRKKPGSRKTRRTTGYCLLAATMAVVGCTPRVEPTPKAYEGTVIKVACPAGPAGAVMASYGKAWGAQSGARVELIVADCRPGAEEAAADIWLIPPVEMPYWAALGRLLPVPDAMLSANDPYNWQDVLKPVYRDKLLVWNRVVYALAVLGSCPLGYYRADVFQDAGNQTAFQAKYGRKLTPPASWDEWEEVAAFFHNRPRLEVDSHWLGLAPLAANDEGVDLEFFCVASSLERRAVRGDDRDKPPEEELFSFHYDLRTGRPRIDRAGFVEALRFLQRVQAYRPAAPAVQPAEAFRAGQAILCLAGSEWVGRFQDDQSPVHGRFGIMRVPGSRRAVDFRDGRVKQLPALNFVAYQDSGGLAAVVPRSAAHPEVAFAFLADLSGPTTSASLVLEPAWSAGIFRRDHLKLYEGGNALGLESSRVRALKEALLQTLMPPIDNPVVRLRTPEQREHLQVLAAAIRSAVLDPQIVAQKALTAVAERWRQLDAVKEEAKRRADYRLSLGLPAQRKDGG
jgi:multiple sugar transport system substrate-binding protein